VRSPTGPFRGSEALTEGLLTRGQLRGPRYRRIYPDVYVPSGMPDNLLTRSKAAYLLVSRQDGVLAGYSAAVLLGADCAPWRAPAEVLVPRNTRAHPGLVIHHGAPDDADITEVAGCRVTTAARSAWDLARRLPLVEAVVAVDALARLGGFPPAELLTRSASHARARHVRRLPGVVRLADPRAESPMETRLRVSLVRAGLPAPEVQYRVIDEHGFVLARVDLAYPEAKLALEYDGNSHFSRQRATVDRQRDAELAGIGWLTIRLGPDDVGAAQTVQRVAHLLTQRGG
jgi:very-short-patch-repair endonuclease